jgi:hypothetical protein
MEDYKIIWICNYILYNNILEEYLFQSKKDKYDLIKWNHDLEIVKIQKLLFFICTKSELLMDIFQFYALPFWASNLITYNYLKDYLKENKSLFDRKILEKNTIKIDNKIKEEIEKSILLLRKENPNLFNLNYVELIEISQKYLTWKMNKLNIMKKEDILNGVLYYK